MSRSCTKVCMGGAVLEIRRERGYCSEKGCVCVGLYVIVSYFFEVHWFWLFLLLSGAFCTFGQGIQFEISERFFLCFT